MNVLQNKAAGIRNRHPPPSRLAEETASRNEERLVGCVREDMSIGVTINM